MQGKKAQAFDLLFKNYLLLQGTFFDGHTGV
jgi:hypothetical protein